MIPHFHEDRLGVILKELEPFKKEIQGIVVESTYNWYWLVDGLPVCVPRTGRQEAKYKSTPGKSCGNAAVFWHEVYGRMTNGIHIGWHTCFD